MRLSYDELPTAHHATLGPSDSLVISQSRIDAFAESTEDRQWIHTDPDRAADGPFGTTIAHGYLTLSLVSTFLEQILVVTGTERVINYGSNRVRYPSPVLAGATVQAAGEIVGVERGDGWTQLEVRIVLSSEGCPRPACVADVLIRYYPSVKG